MGIDFEWDPAKAKSNLRKHWVSFEEASTVFSDERATTIFDPDNSDDEDRFLTLGRSSRKRTIVVSHTDRGDKIRIISARTATPLERREYEEGDSN